jgi:AcrR family transcriptional regulator
VRRTQRHLRDALVELILERGWDAVTVRDVCERADVGRSTFYVHFADKESLLLSGFDELHGALAELSRDAKVPFAFAEALLSHALENVPLFQAVMGRQAGHQVQWRFRDVLVTLLGQEPAVLKLPQASRGWTARFLAGGFIEQLSEVLESPGTARADLLASRFRRLALGVISVARAD